VKLGLPLGLAFALGACSHAPPAQARQGERIVAEGASFTLSYVEADAEAARQVRRALPKAVAIAERWGALSAPIAIKIHPTHEALEAAAHRPGHAWLRAWARADAIELQSPRTWSRGEATDEQMDQLLAHELTHCVMFQAIGGNGRIARSIPVWFREGMATTNARERLVAVNGRPGTIDLLTSAALLDATESTLAYSTADHAFRYLMERYGEPRIHLLLLRIRNGAEFTEAFRNTMGVTVDVFAGDFRNHVGQERTRG
jgi:hypothetical protein